MEVLTNCGSAAHDVCGMGESVVTILPRRRHWVQSHERRRRPVSPLVANGPIYGRSKSETAQSDPSAAIAPAYPAGNGSGCTRGDMGAPAEVRRPQLAVSGRRSTVNS